MTVRVIYFAAARELAACANEELSLAQRDLTLSDFVVLLAQRQPRLAPYLARMRFALNGEFAALDVRVEDGDEITVMPPVAGGSALAEVREAPLSIDEVVAAVRHASAGAIAIFLGVVRDHHEGKPVQRLDYEAYRELADKEMRRVTTELSDEHPGVRVAALHRVGALEIGDVAVVVAASAAHRELAFAVCRAAIDRIKERVPIWKKEWAPDGSGAWINLESDERS
jgi:molybdopterin synthase catalytic subunit